MTTYRLLLKRDVEQNPKQTKVLLVTLAETTPVPEAVKLQTDLRRAGIEPWAWVINNSLAAAGPRSPLLLQRARNERGEIGAVASHYARRYAQYRRRAYRQALRDRFAQSNR